MDRRHKMIRLVFQLCAMIVMVLVGLLVKTSGADKITLSSTNPTAFDIDYGVAREKGFFAKENLDVQPTYMTPDLVIKALIAGTVDSGRSGTRFGMIAASRGAELKIIGGSNYGYPYQVISNPQFKILRSQRAANRKLIPKREPWETFVDAGFMPAPN